MDDFPCDFCGCANEPCDCDWHKTDDVPDLDLMDEGTTEEMSPVTGYKVYADTKLWEEFVEYDTAHMFATALLRNYAAQGVSSLVRIVSGTEVVVINEGPRGDVRTKISRG